MSLLPQRALCFVKETQPQLFVSTFLDIFEAMWKNGKDVSVPDVLTESLQARFDKDQVKAILSAANSTPIKQQLNYNTKEALERGAFGCPWFWVRNAEGAEEPFFGSDRYATLQFRPLLCANRSASGIAWAPADGKVVESSSQILMKAVKRKPILLR
jgi:2-hydroxychromene-2-carboxylate isomerase